MEGNRRRKEGRKKQRERELIALDERHLHNEEREGRDSNRKTERERGGRQRCTQRQKERQTEREI